MPTALRSAWFGILVPACAKIFQSAPQRTAGPIPESCDDVPIFHSSGHKFGARDLHFSKQPFPSFIDENHFFQIDDRARQRRTFARLLSKRA